MSLRTLVRPAGMGASVLGALLSAFLPLSCATSSTSTDGPPQVLPEASIDSHDAAIELVDAPGEPGEAEAALPCYPDSDNDGIPDSVEGAAEGVDTDGDGTPDYQDLDSDADTIPDAVEGDTKNAGCQTPQDSDGDKTPDFRDTDSDDNGLLDRDEVQPEGTAYDPQKGVADTDGDKYPDYADPDNDGDALADTFELASGALIDTDKDGLPDLDDTDSDGDTIDDQFEGTSDQDLDTVPNARDPDSDGDGVPDACEAGKGHKQHDVPVDTDLDGKYDFLELDADGDGLLDGAEDKNGDCQIGVGETDRVYADTDSDGASDLIEITLGSDPNDAIVTPESIGQFYFLLPYNGDASPAQRTLPVDTRLQRADVGFFVDTTGTMTDELTELKNGLTSIITNLGQAIPDVGVGVAAHDDFPTLPYGAVGKDLPFYLPTADAKVTTDQAKALAAVTALGIHDGGDLAESQIPALFRGLTNEYLQWPGNLMSPENIGGATHYGSLAFRANALSVLVEITDAPFHNGRRVGAPSVLHDPYSFNQQSPYKVPTADDLVTAMAAKGARFIGIASDDGARSGDPYEDMAWMADATGSLVPPGSFGGSTCNTSLGGNPLPGGPDGPGGTCRLVFDILENGLGLTDRIIDGVKALVRSLALDVRVVAVSDPPDPANGWTDSVDTFVEYVEVSLSGGDDPTDPAHQCVLLSALQVKDGYVGPKGATPGMDGWNDTVMGVPVGTKICFNLKVVPNTTIPQLDHIQKFHAVLQVRARNGLNPVELDFGPPRDVLFLIPAKPQ
ncbi:MAG: hypothetical protein HY898_32845 [Deltaproteobacteria bacterium]|nr:hypothetical protein [Deltaproteobacteria bacterium]